MRGGPRSVKGRSRVESSSPHAVHHVRFGPVRPIIRTPYSANADGSSRSTTPGEEPMPARRPARTSVRVRPSPSNGSRLPGTVRLEASASSIVFPIPHWMLPRLSRSLLSSSSSGSLCSLLRHAFTVTAITGSWLPGHPPKVGPRLRYQVIALGREQGTAQESTSGQLGAQSGASSSDGATPAIARPRAGLPSSRASMTSCRSSARRVVLP